jgi:predicted DNA-binding protein YlxM (UPF0122 family)
MNTDFPQPSAANRVYIMTGYEVRFWADKFDVSPDRLRDVIKRVGNSLLAVEQELGQQVTALRNPATSAPA